LLSQVASGLNLHKVVLWDPISQGANHHRQLRRAQQQYQRSHALPQLRWPSWRRRGDSQELLGCVLSSRAWRELDALTLDSSFVAAPGVKSLTSSCDWLDLTHLEDMLPDSGISRQLLQLALEQS
jgi:hypothetical protein